MIKRGRDSFNRFKGIINIFVAIYRLMPLNLRKYLFDKHRNVRGKIGLGLRYAILKATADKCGDNVAIYPGVYLYNIENLCIGDNVSIHPMCYIECGYTSGGG
jgi:acetyltransferase-like isoleucine patch superfamily enzyme